MGVRILPASIVNQIAAGEVIERPASVIKELVENSIDAQSSHIKISAQNGGVTNLCVSDDGLGMSKDDLELCIQQHATSKFTGENLLDIRSLGFRGEALPSICSIARVKIVTKQKDEPVGWGLKVDGGRVLDLSPEKCSTGTTVSITDLFYTTPARLKFIKTTATELAHIINIVKTLALANHSIEFRFTSQRKELVFPVAKSLGDRIAEVIGCEVFSEGEVFCFGSIVGRLALEAEADVMDLFPNSSKSVFGDVDPVLECSRTSKYAPLLCSVSPSQNSDFEGFERGPMSLRRQLALDEATEVGTEGSCISAEVGGWLALPTYKNNDIAYWFVNGRCVKDRMLSSAVRVAYQDVTIPGELPPFVLFLNVAAQEVDVNVHPTKTEVRFRRPAEIRSFVIRAIKVKLAGMSRRTPLGLSDKMFTDMSWDSTLRGGHFPHVYDEVYAIGEEPTAESSKSFEISCKEDIWLKNDKGNDFSQQTSHNDSQLPRRDFAFDAGNLALKENGSLPHEFAYQEDGPLPHEFAYPDDLNLGIAKAQLFSSYIISQNADSIFLVDQHAAHERIVFESIKNEVFIDEEGNIVSSLPVQKLLFPERIQLANVGLFQEYLPYLRKMGFGLAIIDPMPRSSKEAKARQDEGIASEHQECADLFSLEIQEVPQILSEANVVALLVRLVNELKDDEIGESFLRKVHKIFADYACHNSVRANHELSYDEMNAVLRLMETTERGGQCNHGRPSYVKITKQRIDNAFGRMHQATKSL